jgi:N-acetylglucosamine-6-phosphate deacetylase
VKTLIKNGRLLDPACRSFSKGALLIEGETIVEVGHVSARSYDRVIDAEGLYVLPGFIDVHAHGAFGANFDLNIDFGEVRTWFARQGITTVSPTLASYPVDKLAPIMAHVFDEAQKKIGASLAGLHLEGPFISPQKRGAMPYPPIPFERSTFEKILQAAKGNLAIMTVAPEIDGAEDLIRLGAEHGVWMSLGHTVASCAEAQAAIEAGARGATHTFNAMRAYDHREPGVLGAVLTDDRVWCEMICDFVHLAPETVQLILRAKGAERVILIDDAASITGVPDGVYDVCGMAVTVKDGVARNPEGRLASSCLSMADGARNLLTLGVSLAEVCRMGAYNPAHVLGLDGITGSLSPGLRADVLVCDARLNLHTVLAAGEEILLD